MALSVRTSVGWFGALLLLLCRIVSGRHAASWTAECPRRGRIQQEVVHVDFGQAAGPREFVSWVYGSRVVDHGRVQCASMRGTDPPS